MPTITLPEAGVNYVVPERGQSFADLALQLYGSVEAGLFDLMVMNPSVAFSSPIAGTSLKYTGRADDPVVNSYTRKPTSSWQEQ